MAQFETVDPVEELTGKWSSNSNIIMRRKTFRHPDGRIIRKGPNEAYEMDKRDYKRAPRTEAEQRQYERWTRVCREASCITKDEHHTRRAEMQTRYTAQLDGEPDSKIGKHITLFGNFVRAVLMKEGRE